MPDSKIVVTQESIPVTEDSAPQGEVNYDALVNQASELGSSLPIKEDVTPGNLDWSEMEPLEEFDRIAAERGVGPQSDQGQPDPQYQPENQHPQQDITDGMSKRISKMKQQEQGRLDVKDGQLAEKDAIIAARNAQIDSLTQMAQKFQTLQQSYVPVQGDADAIDVEISAMDERLTDEGDVYTPAEVARHVQNRAALIEKKNNIARSHENAQGIVKQQQLMRSQSDQYVQDNYGFVNDPKSEYYKTLKEQAYPMLESIIGPGFKNHPQDMVLAAELSQLMVDAAKYQQITGNAPVPRSEAIPMASNVAPSSHPRQPNQPNYRDSVANIRGGGLQSFADLLKNRGHTWRP
jgi:hypothetical protein